MICRYSGTAYSSKQSYRQLVREDAMTNKAVPEGASIANPRRNRGVRWMLSLRE